MTEPNFGRRNVKEFCTSGKEVMKAHDRYVAEPGSPVIDSVLTWSSYYTLVFTSLCAFAPGTAAAAVIQVTEIIV